MTVRIMGGTITFHTSSGVRYTVDHDTPVQRMNEVIAALSTPGYPGLPLWWLSFCDPEKAPPPEEQRPGGPSWLGACIVPGCDSVEAIGNAWALGCNPGGQVAAYPTTAPDASWIGRLLTAEDIDRTDEIEKHSLT